MISPVNSNSSESSSEINDSENEEIIVNMIYKVADIGLKFL